LKIIPGFCCRSGSITIFCRKSYKDAVLKKWSMKEPIPSYVADLTVMAVEADLEKIAAQEDFVFCALDMEKEDIKRIELSYAKAGVPVVSNNSAHRLTEDVPMIIPEINPDHATLIDIQKEKSGI
jgi:aspartate-semialdehyde dehydrogenase